MARILFVMANPTARLVRKIRLAALAAVLVSSLSAPAFATKPTPSPPPSDFDQPAVQFVEPKAGAKLSGVAPVRFALGAVPQIAKFEFGLAGQLWPAQLGASFFLPTRDMPNGRHELIARATYQDGKVIEARIPISIYNPSQRLKLIDPITRDATRGRPVILELTYSEPVRLEVDFRDLDSAFNPALVKVATVRAGVYRVTYPISAGSTRPEGRQKVLFRARNAKGEPVEDHFELELRHAPLMPFAISKCIYTGKVMGAMLVDRIGEGPSLEILPGAPASVARGLRIIALPDLVVDRANHARVLWRAATERNPKRPSESRLVIQAKGYTGYYLCWIPQGTTSGHLELFMAAPGTYGSNLRDGDPIPSEVELMVALETDRVATEWVTHRFAIRPFHWQHPPTAVGKKKVKRPAPVP